MELKKLVVAYSKLRDFEKGNKKYNIKLLADYLSSSYDILEVDKDRRKIFSDQLHGMHLVWIKRVRIIEHAQLMARFTNYKRLDTGVAAFNVRKSFVVTFQKSRKGCACVR